MVHYIDTPSIAWGFSGLGHSDGSAAVALCRSWPLLLIDLIFLVNSFLFVLLVGNPLKAGFISEPCYNLIYLELAACRVTALPSDMARLTPNLRVLNLNYNFLEDVRPLQGLTRLRKLTIIGSRVKSMRDFVKILRGMLDVEMLDFRYVQTPLSAFVVIVLCTYPQLLPDICGADGEQVRRVGGAQYTRFEFVRSERAFNFITRAPPLLPGPRSIHRPR